MISIRPLAAASVLLALGALGVAAAAPTPAGLAAVQARRANFKEIGGAFKAISDEIKTGAPDMNTVRPAARDLAARSAQLGRYFPAGSGPGPGVNTRAKADLWDDPAAFQKFSGALAAASEKLNAAAIRGDVVALASARAEVGGACKSCHDRFRQPE